VNLAFKTDIFYSLADSFSLRCKCKTLLLVALRQILIIYELILHFTAANFITTNFITMFLYNAIYRYMRMRQPYGAVAVSSYRVVSR